MRTLTLLFTGLSLALLSQSAAAESASAVSDVPAGTELRTASTEELDAHLAADLEDYVGSDSAPLVRAQRPFEISAPATGGLLGAFLPSISAWFAEVEGDVQTDEDDDRFDIVDDLGIDDTEITLMPTIQLGFGIGIRFSAFFAKFTGSNTLNRTLDFDGQTFQIAENIDTEISVDNYRGNTLITIIKTDFVQVSLQAGLSWFSAEVEIVGETTGQASESGDFPLPFVGVLIQAKIGKFILEVDAIGFDLEIDGEGGTYLDISASVGYNIFKIFIIRAGYRYILMDVSVADIEIDITIQGFFVGASLAF